LVVKLGKDKGNGGDSHVCFEIDGVADNCRRTLASMAHSNDHGVGLLLDFSP
jgi:hypothetical protein